MTLHDTWLEPTEHATAVSRRLAPLLIAPDTWLIRSVATVASDPSCRYVNSLVIAGAEPVIVDTGSAVTRSAWFEDIFAIVDPADVRRVFVSHADADHAGNLPELLAACPQATVVCDRTTAVHLAIGVDLPACRSQVLAEGDTVATADRRFIVVRPPVWDTPTLGLLDQRTGAYWAADAFGCLVPGPPVDTTDDLDPAMWRQGTTAFTRDHVASWLDLVDHNRFARHCDRIQALGINAIATAHGPAITGAAVADAFSLTRELPTIHLRHHKEH